MIVLALVANTSESLVLVESHDAAHASFVAAAETILARIGHETSDERMSYSFEAWLFHTLTKDGLVYMCCADQDSGRRLPFAFLVQMQKKFLSTFNQALLHTPQPSDFSSFEPTMASLVQHFNESPDSDPVKAAQAELAGVKDIMTRNVEQILNRGERLDLLMDRTDQAAHQSLAFRRRATEIKRNYWWKNIKIMALAGLFALLVIGALVLHFWPRN